MRVREFFEQFKSLEDRKAFIIELVSDAMEKANLSLDGDDVYPDDDDEISYSFRGMYKSWFEFDEKHEAISLSLPIWSRSFDEHSNSGVILTTVTLDLTQDTDLIPKLIEYLMEVKLLVIGTGS